MSYLSVALYADLGLILLPTLAILLYLRDLRAAWGMAYFLQLSLLKLLLLDSAGLLVTFINIWAQRPVFWLWWNDEDGPDPQWWKDRNPTWSEFRRQYWWLAVRNRTDNLQFTGFSPPPKNVDSRTLPNGAIVCWMGWRTYVWTPLPAWCRWSQISYGHTLYSIDNVRILPPIREKGCGFGGKLTPRA